VIRSTLDVVRDLPPEDPRAARVASLRRLHGRGRLVVAVDARALQAAAARGHAIDARAVAELFLAAGGFQVVTPRAALTI
jgi:hypothetical protein